MIKYKLQPFCLLLLVGAINATPISGVFPVSTTIHGNQNSDSLSITADKYSHLAIYNFSEQTFNDLTIEFSVSSPEATSINSYETTLVEARHKCAERVTNVEHYLDGDLMEKSIAGKRIEFPPAKDGVRSSEHQLLLSFPIISQTLEQQSCSGLVSISVELVI